ncbi:hypothetical protein SDJN02_13883, partial [Cucurbita argyrosperma subsp. argyrosperma]
MAKKRKSIATSLDEVDRTMYTSFCSGANSLSQLYTQAMNHQKLSFQAGERHAMKRLSGCTTLEAAVAAFPRKAKSRDLWRRAKVGKTKFFANNTLEDEESRLTRRTMTEPASRSSDHRRPC